MPFASQPAVNIVGLIDTQLGQVVGKMTVAGGLDTDNLVGSTQRYLVDEPKEVEALTAVRVVSFYEANLPT